ncbi:TPA: SGNH/GDSL hydrolase family protein [Escherichia coli]|uniref:SGNH/GDSL hydrolase family protein n=1 Tax=Escherichia coli TaxID=562 RepID=UPI001E3AFAC6|nr:SGNH/GDSL hydrolase family protein [Escherichia coli]MDI0518383.1 SGNH/GDSL hydrolase family protein [Escherichia coli]
MALTLLATNNAESTLASAISATDTSLIVSAGTGAEFPDAVAGESYFKLTLTDAATGSQVEIVNVTAKAGDIFTIERAQEGTLARAWAANDMVANMMTADTLNIIAQYAQQAAASAAQAEEYANNASDYAQNKFTFYKTASDPDGTIAGLAATTDGQSFWVAQGPDALSAAWQYQNKAGVAVLQAKQPGTAAITGTIREFPTLAAAQADAAAGNIPVGSTAYYRSSDDNNLSIEVINTAGTLTATGRKIPAYSALRRGNILFDAFNEYSAVDPKFGAWDWYRGATVTFSTTDANIPLPTPVAQYSGVWSADKYYDLARLPVRVGDQLTFSVLAWFQDAGAKFHIFWMSASGTIISSKSVTGLASGINVPVLTDIVPAGASYVRIRVENTTTGSFKVGAYASAVGSIQPEFIRAAPDKTYMSAIVSSGIAGLTSRVDALQGAISVGYPYAATWQVGKFVNPNTGEITDNAALNCTIIPHSDGDGWLVTALVTGSATALAVYMNAAGTVLGVEGRGTTTPQQYTNYRLNVPSGTTQIGITGRNSAPMSVKKLAVVETATVLASIDSLDSRVQKIEDSLVYDFVQQDVPITSGAYINRSTGAVVTNSAFDCSIFDYTTGDRWKVTARVNGTSVSLAVYFNSVGTVIGTEGDGTSASVDYIDYELTPPTGTARIGITTRVALPIVAKKYVIVPGGSTVSPWSGKIIDVMGDSNVAYNKWQPLVASELGCSFLNHGVGGSKIAKPDSSPSQISMCDDARINALDTTATAWICGPWGTNDWAQNIPIGTISDTVNTTVYGALVIIAQKLRARAPTKPIFWVTPFNGDYETGRTSSWVDGETNQYGRVSDYSAAIRAVALRYGFPLIDLNADCGWTKFNSSYFLLTEGNTNPSHIHLNDSAGPARISELVIDRLTALANLAN